ncbi:MAG: hypothetical protein IKI21_04980 [Oscillospiraceae bacterium]|nr:hypothetical protein [Oscillospiraceae bacterium]
MKRLFCTMTALICLTGCTAAPSPAPPVSVPLTCSCKAAPLTDDPALTGGRFGVRGDRLVLTGYDDDWARVLGLYDTASGEFVKTALPETDGSLEICGFDWRDGTLTVLTATSGRETFSGYTMGYLVYDDTLSLVEERSADPGWDAMQATLDWRVLPDGTEVFARTDGTYLYDTDGIRKITDSSGDLALSPDGTLWITADGGHPQRFDPETMALVPIGMDDLPKSHYNNGGYYDGIGDYALLCTDDTAVYGLSPETGEKTELVRFSDSDLVEASGIAALPDGRFAVRSFDYFDLATQLLLLTPRTEEEVAAIRTLTVGALQFDQEMQSRIARFNRQSDGVRLVLKSWLDPHDTKQSYEAAQQAYFEDLLAGNVPDIVLLDESYQVLANKGLFEDLRPWMEADPEFHEEAYLMSILEACSYRGRLERIPFRFAVECDVAKTAYIGDAAQLEAGDLLAMDLPEDMTYLYSGLGKAEACQGLLHRAAGQFVDYAAGTCRFDSASFCDLLRLADTIPDGKLPEGDWCYRDDRVLLNDVGLTLLDDLHREHEVVFGNEDITLCGIGCEGAVWPICCTAVTSVCQDKDAAWAFIKFNLQKEQQYNPTGHASGFPVERAALAEMLAASTVPHGEHDRAAVTMDGVEIEYGAATQDELEALTAYLDRLHVCILRDPKLDAIVEEEAGKLFDGACTPEEAAAAIQVRAEIYLAEQK